MHVKSVQRQLHDKLEELKEKKSRLQSLPENKIKLFICNIKQVSLNSLKCQQRCIV